MAKAPLVEIFHSIQGEGRFVGVPMVFVRVAVCPIRCRYCDTPESYTAQPQFPVTVGQDVIQQRNPVTAERACELVDRVVGTAGGGPLPISLTGGEPLLYPAFLKRMGEILKTRGQPLHLETAALDPDALGDVLSVVDHLSADYKLPETLQRETREMGDFRSAHRRCVELAVSEGRTVDVKIVLTKSARTLSFRRWHRPCTESTCRTRSTPSRRRSAAFASACTGHRSRNPRPRAPGRQPVGWTRSDEALRSAQRSSGQCCSCPFASRTSRFRPRHC